MISKHFFLTTLAAGILVANAYAAENVAKVVITRGQVKAKLADGTIVDVKNDLSLPEGATLQTADKSFVKLLFIDKSQMNLGPNSQMIITAFPKKEAGIITLVKGQIRSQVTKDYMEISDKDKSKLYIKTKTAAMGVRGTDFQVNFNPSNQNTALITFEGKVAMAHIGIDSRENKFDQKSLERFVSSESAVMVTKGQISAVNLNVAERAMVPTKLGTKQIEALESNETGIKDSETNEATKQFRNPIPPGADGAAFSNNSVEMDKELSKMGLDISNQPNTVSVTSSSNASPEGFFNKATGEYKLPAGSIIDLTTVNIIPPPTNAVFDNNSGTYAIPEAFGKVDKNTGEYKAPAGLSLGNDGQFKVVDATAYQKTQISNQENKTENLPENKSDKSSDVNKEEKKQDDRGPASEGAPPTAGVNQITPPNMFAGRPEMAAFIVENAPTLSTATKRAANQFAPVMGNPLQALAEDQKMRNDVIRKTSSESGIVPTASKVKFIFNAQ